MNDFEILRRIENLEKNIRRLDDKVDLMIGLKYPIGELEKHLIDASIDLREIKRDLKDSQNIIKLIKKGCIAKNEDEI